MAGALAALLLGAGLPASPLAAQSPGPLVTDRPDETESSATVGPGLVQLEAGWTYTRSVEGEREVDSHALPETLVRIGLVPRLEARLGFSGWVSSVEASGGGEAREEGVGDTEVGLKVGLLPARGGRPEVALLGGVTLPTGETGVGSGRADPAFRLAFSHELGGAVSLGYNLGTQWETDPDGTAGADGAEGAPGPPGSGGETATDLLYTLALGVSLTERVGLFGESFGFLGLEEARPDRHSLNGGLTYLVADNLQLDARTGFGVDEDADDWFVGAGVSVRLPR